MIETVPSSVPTSPGPDTHGDIIESQIGGLRGTASVQFPISVQESWIQVQGVEIHQSLYEHDLAIVHIRSRWTRWTETLYPGTPVVIKYSGKRTTENKFYGYVTHVKPTTKMINDFYELDVYCVASSRDLRETGQTVWRNKTAPEIALEIAKKFKYRLITKQHPYRKPQTIQAGETYWEFLKRLAKTIGYVLRVEGGTMFFLPFEDMVMAYGSRAPKLGTVETRDNEYDRPARNMLTMHMWGSDTDTDVDRVSDDSSVAYISPTLNEGVRNRKSPKSAVARQRRDSRYVKYRTDVVAHSRKDADLLAEGDAASGQMAIDAKAVVEGDGYLQPYRPVYVSVKDRSMNQWWIVKEAIHRIDVANGTYYCDLTISADSVESSLLQAAPIKRTRNVALEKSMGWSPSTVREPHLLTTKPGFVRGQTKYNKNAARWVGV